MAWTAPRTWVANEVVSAAIMNTHVRDNLLQTVPAKASAARQTVHSTGANAIAMVTSAVYKSADENVNNSTALQNDDHLAFSIGASEVWAFRMLLYITVASGSPGWKQLFTFPSGCTGWYQSLYLNNSTSVIDSGFVSTNLNLAHTAIGTTLAAGLPGASALMTHQGVITNSTNAGTIQFQWAQNSLVAANLTLKTGSYMQLTRLA